jgi:hypothetical protein
VWNPFRGPKLAAVVIDDETTPAESAENPAYRDELEKVQMRSLLARTQITMIQESLANRALAQLRG